MSGKPDFYLIGTESDDALKKVRACWSAGRRRGSTRDDCMLVRVDPPYDDPVGKRVPTHLVLSSRLAPATLYPVSEWPMHVYVQEVIHESALQTEVLVQNYLGKVSWGMIFPTADQAAAGLAKLRS
jgi:hypothetical protein